MNWLLVFIMWGHHGETVTKMQFQTKYLCVKAAEELTYINQATEREIPVGGHFFCVQTHKVEKPAPQSEKPRVHVANPRFKPGDCVSTYGFEPFKIYEVWQDDRLEQDMYAVVLDASCKEENRVLCNGSGSAYGIETVDREGKQVDCP